MDFARKQLEKYGWTDGKGLGRNEDGIATAIKPKLKFDHSGVGHSPGIEFSNNWWERVYNKAANNINVQVKDEAVQVHVKNKDAVEITTKSYSIKELKKNKNLQYGSFLRTEKLTEDGIENFNVEVPTYTPSVSTLTDQQLFEACGGRTAHKGARHGLKLSGKLSRIEKQEKILLKKMKNVTLADKDCVDKKMKKIKKQKETANVEEVDCSTSCTKRKKKKRKSVSFNSETVVTYFTPDTDDNFENNRDSNSSVPDEGIEQDIGDNNNNNNEKHEDNHRSFEEVQRKIDDLSKAEKRKLKKKRKMDKQNNATSLFLQQLDMEAVDEIDLNKKRKHGNIEDNWPSTSMEVQHTCKKYKCKLVESVIVEKRKKRKKDRKFHDLSNIAQSLGNFCRISDDD